MSFLTLSRLRLGLLVGYSRTFGYPTSSCCINKSSCTFIMPPKNSTSLACVNKLCAVLLVVPSFSGCSIISYMNSNSRNCGNILGTARMTDKSRSFSSLASITTPCTGSSTAWMMGVALDKSRSFASSASISSPAPYLILPPSFEGGHLSYCFYSLAERKVLKPCREKSQESEKLISPDSIYDGIKFVGSSHGWLAVFNNNNYDLFLTDPLSGRNIMLPPFPHVPDPGNLNPRRVVSKIIISCSPDDDEKCRAMMIFGPGNQLAFCCPGRSKEWTPIGELFGYDEDQKRLYSRSYRDFVYSSRQKLFFCWIRDTVEAWDLRDPYFPRNTSYELTCDEEDYPWPFESQEGYDLKEAARQMEYLVFAEHSEDLFLVRRHINPRLLSDGSYDAPIFWGPRRGYDNDMDTYPYRTFGFDVHKIEGLEKLIYMENSLDGLAMFVGNNHSFAIAESTDSRKLNVSPNSIYFTDQLPYGMRRPCGGHDIGIFDYKDKTISPCYYPCDYDSIKRIVPPPIWFTASPLQFE